MTVTANLFQISKGTPVKAVLRNLPCLPECPAGESQSQNLALAGGVSRQWPVYIASLDLMVAVVFVYKQPDGLPTGSRVSRAVCSDSMSDERDNQLALARATKNWGGQWAHTVAAITFAGA